MPGPLPDSIPYGVFHVVAWVTLLGTWTATWLWCSFAVPPFPQVASVLGPQGAATVALFGTTAVWLVAIRPLRRRVDAR